MIRNCIVYSDVYKGRKIIITRIDGFQNYIEVNVHDVMSKGTPTEFLDFISNIISKNVFNTKAFLEKPADNEKVYLCFEVPEPIENGWRSLIKLDELEKECIKTLKKIVDVLED